MHTMESFIFAVTARVLLLETGSYQMMAVHPQLAGLGGQAVPLLIVSLSKPQAVLMPELSKFTLFKS